MKLLATWARAHGQDWREHCLYRVRCCSPHPPTPTCPTPPTQAPHARTRAEGVCELMAHEWVDQDHLSSALLAVLRVLSLADEDAEAEAARGTAAAPARALRLSRKELATAARAAATCTAYGE
jgi:hypothetical protein